MHSDQQPVASRVLQRPHERHPPGALRDTGLWVGIGGDPILSDRWL